MTDKTIKLPPDEITAYFPGCGLVPYISTLASSVHSLKRFRYYRERQKEHRELVRQAIASAHATLAVLEVPNTPNDFYDEDDRAGNAVLQARKLLERINRE